MPEGRGEADVSLGDAFLVESELRPQDDETRAAIDRLLGYTDVTRQVAPAAVGPWKPNEPAAMAAPPTPLASARTTEPTRAATVSMPALEGAVTRAEFVGRIAFDRPDWADTRDDFRPAAGGDGSVSPPPLFSGEHVRAIVSAMFATFQDGDEIDVERVTACLSEGHRLGTIPYVPVATVRRGAQVLIDRADSMHPLRDDIGQLLADLKRLFGPGQLEVLHFAHCPSARDATRRGVSVTPRSRPHEWRSPGGDVPVLIVSDFTLCPITSDETASASVAEWQEFIADVRAAACHPVGLAAYPPSRWPPSLVRLMRFVHWSERTTARQLMRVLRETRRRGRPSP